MNSNRQIIELWETRSAFADDIKIKEGTASAWWQRDSIPKEFWKAIVEAAKTRKFKGVTLEVLADIAAKSLPSDAKRFKQIVKKNGHNHESAFSAG